MHIDPKVKYEKSILEDVKTSQAFINVVTTDVLATSKLLTLAPNSTVLVSWSPERGLQYEDIPEYYEYKNEILSEGCDKEWRGKCIDVAWIDEAIPDYHPVTKPSHYNRKGVECIEAIEAALSEEEFLGYLRGNCLKYTWRCRYKGKPKEDLEKAEWYNNLLLEKLEECGKTEPNTK